MQNELGRTGGKVLAVSVDPHRESLEVAQRLGLNYSILSDPDRRVIREFGVLHEKGAPDGADTALPALFLIDRKGQIAWRHISKRVQDRVDPQDVIQILQRQLNE